jgi:hypothetical protein
MLQARCALLGLGSSYNSLMPAQQEAAQVALEIIADEAVLTAVKSVSIQSHLWYYLKFCNPDCLDGAKEDLFG